METQKINCPLMDNEVITACDCVAYRDIIEGYYKIECLPEKARSKENFREICLKCPNYIE